MTFQVAVRSPFDVSASQQGNIMDLIINHGEVDPRYAQQELPMAQKVITVVDDANNLVAVGAIKRKRLDYARSVRQRAGLFPGMVAYNAMAAGHELGYVASTDEAAELGVFDFILDKLLEMGDSLPGVLWMTTGDFRVASSLQSHGFEKVGDSWSGRRSGRLLELWMKNLPAAGLEAPSTRATPAIGVDGVGKRVMIEDGRSGKIIGQSRDKTHWRIVLDGHSEASVNNVRKEVCTFLGSQEE